MVLASVTSNMPPTLAAALLVECEFLRKFELLGVQLFNVHVLESEHAHRLHEAVRTVDVPHPDIVHRQLEVEVVLGVLTHQLDLVRQVEAAFRLHHIAELADDIPVLPEQRKLDLSVVILELVVIHSASTLRCFAWWSAGAQSAVLRFDKLTWSRQARPALRLSRRARQGRRRALAASARCGDGSPWAPVRQWLPCGRHCRSPCCLPIRSRESRHPLQSSGGPGELLQ